MNEITIELNEKSIDYAIKKLNEYKRWVAKKTGELEERLAMIGAKEASVRFASAIYDGDNDTHVSVEQISDGWKVTANGNAVCFIEFGAGVYHNGTEPYPSNRPEGVSRIGEYGKGHGKRNAWGYTDSDGSTVITRGNPAAMPMWYATEEMRASVQRIAKEVFK